MLIEIVLLVLLVEIVSNELETDQCQFTAVQNGCGILIMFGFLFINYKIESYDSKRPLYSIFDIAARSFVILLLSTGIGYECTEDGNVSFVVIGYFILFNFTLYFLNILNRYGLVANLYSNRTYIQSSCLKKYKSDNNNEEQANYMLGEIHHPEKKLFLSAPSWKSLNFSQRLYAITKINRSHLNGHEVNKLPGDIADVEMCSKSNCYDCCLFNCCLCLGINIFCCEYERELSKAISSSKETSTYGNSCQCCFEMRNTLKIANKEGTPEYFSLSNLTLKSSKALRYFGVSELDNVVFLKMSDAIIEEYSWTAVNNCDVEFMPHVKDINLDRCRCTFRDDALKQLASFLDKKMLLRGLTFNECSLTSKDVDVLVLFEFLSRLLKLEVTNNDVKKTDVDIEIQRVIGALIFKPNSEFSVMGTSFEKSLLEVIYENLTKIPIEESMNYGLKMVLCEQLPLSDKICWKVMDKIYPYFISGMFERFTFDLRKESFMVLYPKSSRYSTVRGNINVRTDVTEQLAWNVVKAIIKGLGNEVFFSC